MFHSIIFSFLPLLHCIVALILIVHKLQKVSLRTVCTSKYCFSLSMDQTKVPQQITLSSRSVGLFVDFLGLKTGVTLLLLYQQLSPRLTHLCFILLIFFISNRHSNAFIEAHLAQYIFHLGKYRLKSGNFATSQLFLSAIKM